ncbi:thioesterase II family protein [Actinoplanes derwentensis]|uniref:Medium-chain acyl-[acyl-carrier-protein] hydrolase n=1 Tax=Actinoplanes derwentensis TaxID=113562 RepID=A0A1H1R7Z7_9ACTN|nr:alpha/beta fold hydrolase [Actinoplanes derwentensis]GID88040.1 oleoyl-ACP hydrolase [Actinoplanes derwentensis]SDS31907.1 medium-chain acyl-[acyl-carrier-protein] hydrolase [Actinoplanes derwentensis]
MSSRWISGLLPGDGATRLFCFAHAGGGSRFFLPWREALAPHVQVCSIVLPGRESRLREEPRTSLGPLVRELTAALGPYLDRPFAFFGHSLGALLAYETARQLIAEGRPEPSVLLASGRQAPRHPRQSSLHLLPTGQFIDHLIALGGTAAATGLRRRLLESFVPMLRADYALTETYRAGPGPELSGPVVAYHGRQDPVATEEQVDRWREATTGEFRLRMFDGGHFYHQGAPAVVMDAVRSDLAAAGLLRAGVR